MVFHIFWHEFWSAAPSWIWSFPFLWFSPGLKYQRCNAPTNKRNSSHHCHSPPSSSSGLDFVQKRGFKKKIFITTATRQQQPAFLSFFREKDFKKRPRWLLVTYPHSHRTSCEFHTDSCWTRNWKKVWRCEKKEQRTWMETECEVEGKHLENRSWCFYTWKKHRKSSAIEQVWRSVKVVSERRRRHENGGEKMIRNTEEKHQSSSPLKTSNPFGSLCFLFLKSALTYFKSG